MGVGGGENVSSSEQKVNNTVACGVCVLREVLEAKSIKAGFCLVPTQITYQEQNAEDNATGRCSRETNGDGVHEKFMQ